MKEVLFVSNHKSKFNGKNLLPFYEYYLGHD